MNLAGNKVQILPASVAEKIAAGEVIERPASVVKELVENALDANATQLAVILKEGGKDLIEVIDNGSGMKPADLALCLHRHATSKLRSLDDLEQIHSLGFRGEALASIAAVSHLSIVSKKANSRAHEVQADHNARDFKPPKEITFGHFLGEEHGTQVKVEGLFSQVPARLKFLKSARSETAYIRDSLERLALTCPNVGFKLVHIGGQSRGPQGKKENVLLDLQPQSIEDRLTHILSDGNQYPIQVKKKITSDAQCEIYWLQGFSLSNSKKLVQMVNQRVLRDRLLQQAVMSAFRQALLPGQFPALLLKIEIDPRLLDVNVHPTKTEVRFLESQKIFRLVQQTLEGLISEKGSISYAPTQARNEVHIESGSRSSVFKPQILGAQEAAIWRPDTSAGPGAAIQETLDNYTEASEISHPFKGYRYVGTLFQTYVAYEAENELQLLDQHAAHERVRYESLKKQALSDQPQRQELLFPEVVKLKKEELRNIDVSILEKLGFEVEALSEESLAFRAIPAAWGEFSLKTRLSNLVQRVINESAKGRELKLDEVLFEKLASEACHSAIRAGDRIDEYRSKQLIEDLFSCQHPWNCPHGRPTVVKIPRVKFEEWFQRKI